MADDKPEVKFQPVMRMAYEVPGGAHVFEVDALNAWMLMAGKRVGRKPTPREKQLLERTRQALEALVAEVATTDEAEKG